jgi:hypothetical protein
MYLKEKFIPFTSSDHWPIKLNLILYDTLSLCHFRFEALWIHHPSFMEKIEQWWNESKSIQGIPMYHFQQCLKFIKNKLKKWNKETFGNIFKEKEKLEIKLE